MVKPPTQTSSRWAALAPLLHPSHTPLCPPCTPLIPLLYPCDSPVTAPLHPLYIPHIPTCTPVTPLPHPSYIPLTQLLQLYNAPQLALPGTCLTVSWNHCCVECHLHGRLRLPTQLAGLQHAFACGGKQCTHGQNVTIQYKH